MSDFFGKIFLFIGIAILVALAFKNPYILVVILIIATFVGIKEENFEEEINKIEEKPTTYSHSISDNTISKIFLLGNTTIKNSILFDLPATNEKSYLIDLENFFKYLPCSNSQKDAFVKNLKKYCKKSKNKERANIILKAIYTREQKIKEEFENRTDRFY